MVSVEFQFSLQDFHFVPGTVVNSQKQDNLSSKTSPASTRDYETKIVWAPATGTTMVAWREGYGKGEERKMSVSAKEESCIPCCVPYPPCTGQLRTSDDGLHYY
jgi:hypothetical protein